MRHCPICSGKTLRHIRNNQIYWYCSHCHQEVPDLKRIPELKMSNLRNYPQFGIQSPSEQEPIYKA